MTLSDNTQCSLKVNSKIKHIKLIYTLTLEVVAAPLRTMHLPDPSCRFRPIGREAVTLSHQLCTAVCSFNRLSWTRFVLCITAQGGFQASTISMLSTH
jgi:hypothetical protein